MWDLNGNYLIIKNLEFQGGSKGLRFGETQDCSNLIIDNLKIHDTATSAFTMNQEGRTYSNIVIRNTVVYNTGNVYFNNTRNIED